MTILETAMGDTDGYERGMVEEIEALPSVRDIRIIPISDHEWRISDIRRNESDGMALLGFVERVGDRYEVTELGARPVRVYRDTLAAATNYLAKHERVMPSRMYLAATRKRK